MATDRRHALFALVAAGLLWGSTVPLTKLALDEVGAGWLTVARFALAAPLLALLARRTLGDALRWDVAGWGALGYGAVILIQNAGIARTSVSHAALLVGTVPVIVALIAAGLGRGSTGPLAWAGFALALGGVGLIAGDGAGTASLTGDLLVLGSLVLSAGAVVAQPALLRGRDPVAVTAVQLGAGALAALPAALLFEGAPPALPGPEVLGALGALVVAGTILPYTLFAFGQSKVAPEVAGAFLNLEPLVGAAAGMLAFGDPVGPVQLLGALAILGGIALSTGGAGRDRRPRDTRYAGPEPCPASG